MAYTPTTWVENTTTLGPTNMNHLEAGVQAAAAVADTATSAAAAAATTANAAIPKPAGIVSGEAAIWNGSTFVRSSVTNLAATSLGSGTPDSTKYLRGDSTWALGSSFYRKTTSKQVVNTVTETDLLNGEITLAAGDLGTTRVLRARLAGDWVQNSGAARDIPRIKFKLGATTLFDSNVFGANNIAASVTREPWEFDITIANLGAANSQWATIRGMMDLGAVPAGTGDLNPATGIGQSIIAGAPFFQLITHSAISAAVDTTASLALAVTVTLPFASASHDVTLKHALVVIE